MQDHQPRRFRINRVWAKNFRSVEDSTLELDSLTVLVGRNASGKSNLMDALSFIKDSLSFDLEAAISLRRGISDIRRSQLGGGRRRNIEVGINVETTRFRRQSNIDYGFVIASNAAGQYRVRRESGVIWQDSSNDQLFQFEVRNGKLVSPVSPSVKHNSLDASPDEEGSQFEATSLVLPALNRMFFLRLSEKTDDSDRRRLDHLTFDGLRRSLTKMRFYHIFPNAIREPQKLGNSYPLDENGGNFASVLRAMSKDTSSRMPYLREALQRLIPDVSDLRVVSVGGYLAVQLRHESAERERSAWFDLSQESDGTLRLLGLLVALNQTPPLPLIGIEEPELTLHPGALMVLADLLREASRRSQIIVTTHSPDLIDQLPIENLRVVDFHEGTTTVELIPHAQLEAVRLNLFSPGELHRMGEFTTSRKGS